MRGLFKATHSHTFTLSICRAPPQILFSVTSILPFFFLLSPCFLSPCLALLLLSSFPFPSFYPFVLLPALLYLVFSSPSLLSLSLSFLSSLLSSLLHPLLFLRPLLSVCVTHFLGPGPINHSAVGSACLPPCPAALPHHSR